MKRRSILALLLALVLAFSALALTACGDPADTTTGTVNSTGEPGENQNPTADGKINVKFFKVGKANATLIRTADAAILIDTGDEKDEDGNGKTDDGEKILEYLAEKSITKLDYVIISQFNKKHYGSLGTIMEGVTVEKVIEPDYDKTGAQYENYRKVLADANITPQVISKKTTFSCSGIDFTLYPATTTTSSADQDEFYSLAITAESGDFSMLLASDIFGARTTALIEELDGKTFDLLQVPFHGAYNDTVEALVSAVSPKYAVIFASDNNPEDVRVMNLLQKKEITAYVTKGGSVEAKFKDGKLTVKQ